MYIQINPEYIIANFDKPINILRQIRILNYEISKRQLEKRLSRA